MTVTEKIPKTEIPTWDPSIPVIISAPTGSGKSHFIKNSLYDYAASHHQRILMLIHRANCVEQFQAELEAAYKTEVITVRTYQTIEAAALQGVDYNLSYYDYIVADEFHYFIADAGFNNTTDISFKKILDSNSIKIFMSATPVNMGVYLRYYKNMEFKTYSINRHWSFIKQIYFDYSSDGPERYAEQVIKSGKKGIIFLNDVSRAYSIYLTYKKYSIFNCSKSNKHYKYVDEEKISEILLNEKFDTPLLITTSCMDSGVNIKDDALKSMYINITDRDSLIQCIGRKRLKSREKIDLYIKGYTRTHIRNWIKHWEEMLEEVNYLNKYGTDNYIKKYGRNRSSPIIYEVQNDKDTDSCRLKINELMMMKYQFAIEYFRDEVLLRDTNDFAFCNCLAIDLGRRTKEGNINYDFFRNDCSQIQYLKDHEGEVLLTKDDREELINKINIRVNGIQKRSLKWINIALETDKIPFCIEQFSTHKTINGIRKSYKNAWRIVSHNWNK